MEANPPLTPCPVCGSGIALGARKCPNCLEFLDGRNQANGSEHAVRAEVVKGAFDLLGRALIPVAIIAALLLFRVEISAKLRDTQAIELGTVGIRFSFPENKGGNVELDALALYYLLDTARHQADYKGELNYDALGTDEKRAIDLLKENRLVAATLVERSDQQAGVKRSLTLSVTKKGRAFLHSSNLDNILPGK